MAERETAFWEVCLNLLELLAIPYLLEAEAVETESGKWLLRLAYPELPGCIAEGSTLEDVLGELERRRIEIIVGLVEAGEEPPVPRKALVTSDPLWTVKDLGLSGRVTALLENSTK
jgi:predicted RNase H-like HicB family nuclease